MAKAKLKKAKAIPKKQSARTRRTAKPKSPARAESAPRKKAGTISKKLEKVSVEEVSPRLVVAEKKEEVAAMEEREVGEVTNYFEHVQAAAIRLVASLNAGDTIHIKGGEVDFEQGVTSMQINRVPVSSANPGDEVGIRVNQHVRKGYKVFVK